MDVASALISIVYFYYYLIIYTDLNDKLAGGLRGVSPRWQQYTIIRQQMYTNLDRIHISDILSSLMI